MPAIPAVLPPKKRQRGRPKKATAALAAAAEAVPTAQAALGDEPLTPLQTAKAPKAPARKRAAAGGKRAAKGQTRGAASTASAAVVPCSDEAPELVDVKRELPDVKVRFRAYAVTLRVDSLRYRASAYTGIMSSLPPCHPTSCCDPTPAHRPSVEMLIQSLAHAG